jgi:tripartite-type tricarboxylate transporter receptor subunit TctC
MRMANYSAAKLGGAYAVLLGSALLGAAAAAAADAYPVRPVRMIVSYPAGGGADFFARVLARKLGETLRQQVIVDNRPGGGGSIGAEIAARAAPDGYTLFLVNISFAVNPSFFKRLSFDSVRDFAAVSQVATLANALVVYPAVEIKSVPDLIAFAKQRPGQLNYGSAGNGSSTHLAAELFKNLAAVDIVHVPYKGAADAITAIIGGQVQLMFASLPSALPHVRSSRLRALGVTGRTRSRAASDIPTVAEAGLPGYEMSSWNGILTRAGTPPATISQLNRAIGEALRTPDLIEVYAREGSEAVGSTPEQFDALVRSEIVRWAKIIKQAGIKPD